MRHVLAVQAVIEISLSLKYGLVREGMAQVPGDAYLRNWLNFGCL
jgi:hypothetical protein